MKPNHYRCGDCGHIHQGKPDPQWKMCPTCLEAFLRQYNELAKPKKPDPPKQLELFR